MKENWGLILWVVFMCIMGVIIGGGMLLEQKEDRKLYKECLADNKKEYECAMLLK